EPRPGETPLSVSRCARDVEELGRLFDGQAGEEMQLDELRRLGVGLGQSCEGLVQGDDLVRERSQGQFLVSQLNTLEGAAMLDGFFASGTLDQNTPHGLGSGREKVSLPVKTLLADQTQISFVDQRGRLQRLPRRLKGELLGRQSAQLVIDQR